jgi:hypothetical protein
VTCQEKVGAGEMEGNERGCTIEHREVTERLPKPTGLGSSLDCVG